MSDAAWKRPQFPLNDSQSDYTKGEPETGPAWSHPCSVLAPSILQSSLKCVVSSLGLTATFFFFFLVKFFSQFLSRILKYYVKRQISNRCEVKSGINICTGEIGHKLFILRKILSKQCTFPFLFFLFFFFFSLFWGPCSPFAIKLSLVTLQSKRKLF